MTWADHLVIAPIVIPLLAGGAMLMFEGRRREVVAGINVLATLAQLAVAIAILAESVRVSSAQVVIVDLVGDCPIEFGIVVVADQLVALMLVLTALLACAALLFALAYWHCA